MNDKNTVHIVGRDLPISTKHSIEICKFIRRKPIQLAKKQLSLVLEKKIAVPLKRFNKDRGHRKGKIAAGFYPQKATREFLKLLTSLEGYATHQGLDKNNLYIKEIIPNQAPRSYHYGRIRGIQNRSTHIKIIAAELEKKQIKKPEVKKTKEQHKKVEQIPKEKK